MPIIKKETPAVQPCTVYEIAAQAADEKKSLEYYDFKYRRILSYGGLFRHLQRT